MTQTFLFTEKEKLEKEKTKPLNPEQIQGLIDRLLKKKKKNQAKSKPAPSPYRLLPKPETKTR